MQEASKHDVKVKLKKGDEVIVLCGKSRGATGKIDRIDRKSLRAYVAGVNIYKRHRKPDMTMPEGGIIDKPMSLHISNIAIVDPKTKKASKLGYRLEDGKKIRISRASGSPV